MSHGAYSPMKALWHIDSLAALRRGEQPVPKHVQLIISDLCNQDCHECLVSGTLISTPSGQVPIESIRSGDTVVGPDGSVVPVESVGSRSVREVYEITVGENVVRASGEHPFLTQRGWVRADDLSTGDSAVVRVRMRTSDEMERASQEVGRLPLRPFEVAASEPVLEDGQGFEIGRGLSGSTRLPMWVRAAGSSASAWCSSLLGRLSASPSGEGSQYSFSDDTGTSCCSNESRQPHEETGSSQGGRGEGPWTAAKTLARGSRQVVRDGSCQDEVGSQPDEGRCHPQRRLAEGAVSSALEERAALRGLGKGQWNGAVSGWWRDLLDWKTKPRLQGSGSEEGHRSDTADLLRWWPAGSYRRDLRGSHHIPLFKQGMELLGDLQAGPQVHHPKLSHSRPERLSLEGIELERDLELRPIDSVVRVEGELTVHNLSCPPVSAYEANGIVVHNCPYRMEGYTSNQHFGALDKNGNFTNNPTRFIPIKKIREILDDCRAMGIRAVQLTGGGEPTVHPQFDEVVDDVLDRGLDLALVTNGVKMSARAIESLMRATWLRVSIDASNATTYSRYRRCPEGHWTKMIGNLERLVATKRQTGSGVTIGVGFVVTRENHREIADLVLLARKIGVDNVRISAAFTTEGSEYHRDIFAEAKRQAARSVSLSTPTFRVYDMLGDRVGDLEEGAPDYGFCGIQHFTTYIGGDQRVYRCCVTSYNDQGFLGDLKEQRLADLWSSGDKRQRMQTFDARTCERCMFNARNRAINSALAQPEHENFT